MEVIRKIVDLNRLRSAIDIPQSFKVNEGNKVVFDGGDVERIDAASLQLFYSFIEQARVKGVDIEWRSPSDILRNNAKLLGMEEALQLNNAA